MAAWQWCAEALVAVLVLLVLFGLSLVIRRRLISRHGGTFELAYRVRDSIPGRGWVLGIGRYSGEQLEWFRIFSVSPGPRRVWDRKTMEYAGRREPEGIETMSLYPDHVVVSCVTPDGPISLAMSQPALTGFQSWLEAGPPGAEIR